MFCHKLTQLRESKDLNKKQMAEELGLQYMTYCRYENGEREPGYDVLLSIAEYFNISVDSLIGNDMKFTICPHDDDSAKIKCPVCGYEKVHFVRSSGVDFGDETSCGCAVEFKCACGHVFYHVFETYNSNTFSLYSDKDSVLSELPAARKADLRAASPEYDAAEFRRKYHRIDAHGKKLLNSILDLEYQRCLDNGKKETFIFRRLSANKASAGCGYDLSNADEWKEIEVIDTSEARQADFAVEIEGESMMPEFADGDIVYVQLTKNVPVGKTGLFMQNGKGYVKKCGEDRLISVNEEYDDIYPDDGNIECIGLVIGVAEFP